MIQYHGADLLNRWNLLEEENDNEEGIVFSYLLLLLYVWYDLGPDKSCDKTIVGSFQVLWLPNSQSFLESANQLHSSTATSTSYSGSTSFTLIKSSGEKAALRNSFHSVLETHCQMLSVQSSPRQHQETVIILDYKKKTDCQKIY